MSFISRTQQSITFGLFTFASGLGIGSQVGIMLVLWCILGQWMCVFQPEQNKGVGKWVALAVLPLYFNPTSHFLENLNRGLESLTQYLDLIVMTKRL